MFHGGAASTDGDGGRGWQRAKLDGGLALNCTQDPRQGKRRREAGLSKESRPYFEAERFSGVMLACTPRRSCGRGCLRRPRGGRASKVVNAVRALGVSTAVQYGRRLRWPLSAIDPSSPIHIRPHFCSALSALHCRPLPRRCCCCCCCCSTCSAHGAGVFLLLLVLWGRLGYRMPSARPSIGFRLGVLWDRVMCNSVAAGGSIAL